MGLLLVPFVKAYDNYQTNKRIGDTTLAMALVNQSIANYYSVNRRYPCPGDRSAGFNQPQHGDEQCAAFTAMGDDTCSGSEGLCRASSAVPNSPVYIGSIPYATLGIPAAQTLDGWKGSFTYVVTANMTAAATFSAAVGSVDLVNENGTPVNSAAANTGLHGLVLSSGTDGLGAFNQAGVGSPCPTSGQQAENCDNDSTFRNSLIFEAPGATYFDDYIVTNAWQQTNIWVYTGADDNIENTNTGNVGIGTSAPQQPLDVNGNIRSTNVHAQEYCNTEGEDCMHPDVVGGAGRTCLNDREYMRGIANNEISCTPVSFNATGTCGSGQFVTGITATGNVICAVVPTP